MAACAESHLPTLLGARTEGLSGGSWKSSLREKQPRLDVCSLNAGSYQPDLDRKLGSGAFGQVYPVIGMPDKVVKVFRRHDWKEVVKESTFARHMKAHDPIHYVDCYGIGSSTAESDGGEQFFAVFQRAPGITLSDAAPRFHHPRGICHVKQALDVLDQLLAIMEKMLTPDEAGELQFHLDLKPQNIMVNRCEDSWDLRVALVDYGLVRACPPGPEAQDAVLQLFRWLGWEFLWVFASEAFSLNGRDDQGPWEQLPEGFRPFFWRSDFRPTAYQTDKISESLLQEALEEDFFEKVLSPPFRKQWTRKSAAKAQLGGMLGEIFNGVALASDRFDYEPQFADLRCRVGALKDLAQL